MTRRPAGEQTPWTYLHQLRRRARLSRTELAQRIGCTYGWLCQIECGSRSPGEETVARIAEVFQLDIFELELTLPPASRPRAHHKIRVAP